MFNPLWDEHRISDETLIDNTTKMKLKQNLFFDDLELFQPDIKLFFLENEIFLITQFLFFIYKHSLTS